MVTGKTVWGPKVPTFKGTGASLSCAQCFLYLVSSSITASIFLFFFFFLYFIVVQLQLSAFIPTTPSPFFMLHGWIPSGQTLKFLSSVLHVWNFSQMLKNYMSMQDVLSALNIYPHTFITLSFKSPQTFLTQSLFLIENTIEYERLLVLKW